jgi:transposase
MTTKKTAASYSPEVRGRAVRLMLDGVGEHPTRWLAINSVAAKPRRCCRRRWRGF